MSKDDIPMNDMLLLKEATCPKVSLRSDGKLNYRIAKALDGSEVFVAITGNDSIGYFSQEFVALTAIDTCLSKSLAGALHCPEDLQ
jgi:BioD-like phosphotransacetylase family protein